MARCSATLRSMAPSLRAARQSGFLRKVQTRGYDRVLVGCTDQYLERQDQRLQPQDHCMHDADGIDGVQPHPPPDSDVGLRQQVVIVCIAFAMQLLPAVTPSNPPL